MHPALATLPSFPTPLDQYPVTPGAGLSDILAARVSLVPFNAAATAIFFLAIAHTFLAQRFTALSHRVQEAHENRERAAGRPETPSFQAELLHFLGEVEVVFGMWAVALAGVIAFFYDWDTVKRYINSTVNYNEALFVVVIMALASTRPIVTLAERALSRIAGLGRATPAAWWFTLLTIGPLLGSFITEPAAMTICALLLGRQFYELGPSRRLAYATLGLLFVNVSIGGTLTHFAAPPVLMVARPWGWDTAFMLSHFGWKAAAGIVTGNLLYFLAFRKELLGMRVPDSLAAASRGVAPIVPAWIVLVHVFFMAWTVVNAHYPALFIAGFLFFLGFLRATAPHQNAVDLKAPLLVGFFLGGLVVHGGLQGWWISPVLSSLGETKLFLGAGLLTAFNDNALITYLATLVPHLSETMKHAVVEGAVAGGGLTVIANAPNPAGQSILSRYFADGISPVGLLAGALLPTLVVSAFLFFL
jgi:Putative Na+/H+ antiporter